MQYLTQSFQVLKSYAIEELLKESKSYAVYSLFQLRNLFF